MSGMGAADSMMKSFKNNMKLKGLRKGLKEIYEENKFHKGKALIYHKSSPERLKKLDDLYSKRRKNFIQKSVIILGILSTLMCTGIYFALFN